jgi:5'-phosphate synthase pdxT subunit
VREHVAALGNLGVATRLVRHPADLEGIGALVLPGGESTTMVKLARAFELLEPLRVAVKGGLPVLGTCAGMILMADRILDGVAGQDGIGGMDIAVRRNAFGRQVDSFETDLDVLGIDDPVHAVFIRAPWVEATGPDVEVLAVIDTGPAAGRIVAVRQGGSIATAFHPEVDGNGRVHALFLDGIG